MRTHSGCCVRRPQRAVPVKRGRRTSRGRVSESLLRLEVPRLLGVEVELGPRLPGRGGQSLGPLDARDEAPARRPEGELGIDVRDARDVDDGEEEVADLVEHAAGRPRISGAGRPARASSDSISASSSRIFASGPSSPGQSNPTAAARRCTLRAWMSAGSAAGTSWKTPLRPSCSDLISLPLRAHSPRRVGLGVAEDVRVPADELRVHRPRDCLEVTLTLLLEEQREEVRLEEQVPELVQQLGGARRRSRRRRPRTPPPPCAGRSCAPSAPGPRDSRGGAAGSAPAARRAPPRASRRLLAARAQLVVVAGVVAVAGGANPVPYLTFFAKYFLTSSVHFVIASFFALSSSCALICGVASFSEVVAGGSHVGDRLDHVVAELGLDRTARSAWSTTGMRSCRTAPRSGPA